MISTLPVQIMIYIFMIYWLNEYQNWNVIHYKKRKLKFSQFLIFKSIMMPAGTVCYYVYEDIRSGDLDRYLVLPISYIKNIEICINIYKSRVAEKASVGCRKDNVLLKRSVNMLFFRRFSPCFCYQYFFLSVLRAVYIGLRS